MRILITGATGFLGSYLAVRLKEAGHAVAGLSRQGDRGRRATHALSAMTRWDPASEMPPLEALEGVDAVVNLAGEGLVGRWTAEKKRAIRDSRILGTRNLVAAMAAMSSPRPGVLVSMSASGYHGEAGDETLDEGSPPGGGFLAGVVADWEGEAARAEDLGVRVALLRTGIVLGNGGALRRLLPTARLGLGGPLGSGRQWWSWVHIADLAGAVEHVMGGDVSGPVVVAAPDPVRQREFAATLGRVLRRPAVAPVPAWALRLGLGEVATELMWSRRMTPRRLLDTGFAFHFPTLERALRDLLTPSGG